MISSGYGLKFIGIAGMMVLLSACASGPPEDIVLKGSMNAVETVNPDVQGRPSPLVIKIYQLKAKDKFELAGFFELFDQADATLGADMLGVEDVMMTPGEIRSYEGVVNPNTRFIGVVGAYRDINQAQWRAVVPMPEKNILKFLQRNPLTISAGRLAIKVSVGK